MSGSKKATPKETPAQEPKSTPEEQAAAPSQAAQATAAVSGAVSVVREKLIAGEQIALSAAGLIVVVWIIWDLIFDVPSGVAVTVGTFPLLIAVLMVLSIWVHRWGHYDFGKGYRILLGAFGVSLALFAVTDLLLTFRTGVDAGGAGGWLGNLLYWIGGIFALYGSWMVFRTREN